MKLLQTLLISFILPNTILAEEQSSVILDKDNYDSKIANGLWFIKYYAPWCKFSKRLAPTWTKFTEAQKELTADKKFNFGEVDCQANEKLCNKFKVDGYPTLFLQNKEGTIEEYLGGQSEEELTEYAKKEAQKAKNGETKPIETKPEVKEETPKAVETVKEVEAPKVKAQVDNYAYPSASGEVKDLTKGDDFQKAVDTKATWIMKFYIPTCPHCQAMAPIYKALAENYKDKVNFGEINCQKNQELCSDQGAKGVPHFKMFYKGEGKDSIVGETTRDKLKGLIQDYITPSFVELKTKEIADKDADSDPTLVYFGDGKNDEEYKAKFQDNMVGLNLMTGAVVYTKDPELKSSLSTTLKNTPTLFMISKDGIFEYEHALDGFKDLKNWIDLNKYPLDYQLTPSRLNEAIEKYIIVLKLTENGDASEDLKTAALSYRKESDSINKTPVLFGHGSTNLVDPLYLLGVPKPSSYPYTLVINPSKSVYFDEGDSGKNIELDSEHLIPTLHAIQDNSIQGSALVPKTGSFIRDHFYIVIFGILGVGLVGFIIYKKRNGGFQYSKVE